MLHPSLWRSLAIQLSVLLLVAAQTYHAVIIQIQADNYDITTGQLGFVISMFYVGYFAACIWMKDFIAQLGHVRGHALMTTIYGLAALTFPIYPNVYSWSILYGICGLSIGGMFVVFESWLNFSTNNKGRGQIMGLYMIMTLAGKIIGNYTFNLISIFSFSHYSYITMFILASMLPLLATGLKQPKAEKIEYMPIKTVYKISPAAFIIIFLGQIGTTSANTLGATFGKLLNLSELYISHLMTIIFVSAIVIQIPIGAISNRMDRRFVALCMAGLLMIGSGLIFIATPETILFWFSIALMGGACFAFYPLAAAHINDLLHHKHRTAANSQMLLIASLGQIIGPMATSTAMAKFGYVGFALILLLEALMIALFLINRLRIRKPEKHGVLLNFVPDLPLTPQIAEPLGLKRTKYRKS